MLLSKAGWCEAEGEQNTPKLQKYLILYEQNSLPAIIIPINLHNLLTEIHSTIWM